MIDVSTLAIAVKSDGIREATKGLNDLAAAATKVDNAVAPIVSKVNSMSSSVKATAASSASATSAAEKYISKLQLKADILGKTAAQTEMLRAKQKGFSAETVKQAEQFGVAIDKQRAALEAANSKGTIFNNTVKSMISAFLLYKSVGFAKGILEAGDSWAMMASRLKVATGSMEEAVKVQGQLFNVAQSLRVPLEDSTRLYTRMLVPMKALGKTSEDVMKVTEGVGLALQLNGSTGAEASSVMLQFSQSMAAGRLNGQELNAVLEGAPPIIRAIEAELARTGKGFAATGKTIKQMGADGEIGIDLITNAIKNATPQWRKDFSELPITVDSALTVIKNAWVKTMGEMSSETDLNKNLSKALMSIVDIMPTVKDIMVTSIVFISDNIKGLTFLLSAMIGLKLVTWATSAATALGTLAVGATAASAATSTVVAGIARFAGPVGLAVTAIGLLYEGYKLWFDNAPTQSNKVTAVTVADTDTRIVAIRKEINALNERYAAASKTVPTAATSTAARDDETVIKNQKIISDLKKAQAAATNDQVKSAMQISIDARQADNDKITSLINIRNATSAANDMQVKTAAQAKLFSTERIKYDKDYAEQQKLDAIKAMDLTDEQKKKLIDLAITKFDKAATTKAVAEESRQQKAITALNAKYQEQLEIKAKLDDESGASKKLSANEKALILLKEEALIAKGVEKSNVAALITKAEQVVAQEKLNTAQKNQIDYEKRLATQQAELSVIQENYDLQLSMLSLGDKEAANQEKIFNIQKKYAEQRTQLENDNAAGIAGDYEKRLALIAAGLEKEVAMHQAAATRKGIIESTWQAGASKAVANYYDESQNLSKQYEGVFNTGLKGMEDALVEFATTGKLSFKDFANSIIAEMARIQAKQLVASIMGKGGESGGGIFGSLLQMGIGYLTGGASGALTAGMGAGSSLTGGTSSGIGFSGTGTTSGLKFADGGAFTNGVVSKATDFNMATMGEAGAEAIMPLKRTSDGSLGVVAADGGGSSAKAPETIQLSYAPVIHIDARSDRADIEKMVSKTIATSQAELVERMQRSRRS